MQSTFILCCKSQCPFLVLPPNFCTSKSHHIPPNPAIKEKEKRNLNNRLLVHSIHKRPFGDYWLRSWVRVLQFVIHLPFTAEPITSCGFFLIEKLMIYSWNMIWSYAWFPFLGIQQNPILRLFPFLRIYWNQILWFLTKQAPWFHAALV